MSAQARPRVLQITACPFPPEIRVLKAARSLRDAGYDSAVMCPPMAGRPEYEEWNGITILRPGSLAMAAASWDKLLFQSAFFSPAWWRAIREARERFRPHVLHVHDIWLARTAFSARGTEKVVMDLHENMPAAVVEYLKAYKGALETFNAVFKTHRRVLRYERSVLRRSDLVLAVVEEAADRVHADHPGLRRKVAVVENLESKAFLLDARSAPTVADPDPRPSVLYIGGFGPHRGIDTLIRAAALLKEWGVAVRVDLIGAKPGAYVDMMRALVDELDVTSHVRMVEWVPAEAVLSLIKSASIGAVPHHSNPHTDSTIPHKLYQYMIASTPVLVSTSAPLARTVRAARAGGIFVAGDPPSCAGKIREMLADPVVLRTYGANGHDYVLRQGHNWEEESTPALLAAYGSLLGADQARPSV